MPANHSFHPSDGSAWTYLCHSLYSDDHGETWKIGETSEPGASESQIAEVSEDLLIQDIRMQTHRKNKRAVRFSRDGGVTWTPLEHDLNRNCPKCQGSIISIPQTGTNLLVVSNPVGWDRSQMTLRSSADGGKTWQGNIVIEPGRSAYSDLVQIDDETIGFLIERGPNNPYEKISFGTHSIDLLR